MSSLMLSNDLDIMMLEFAVEKLFIPRKSVFDTVIMKKTTVMFRMLDLDWISVNPHRTDYLPYKGSNHEEQNFHGGKSVVFAIPSGSLEKRMKDVDIQITVIREVSKYFEVDSNLKRQNVGVALANVDCLFNGIIKDLREREELKNYLNGFHERQPISRSSKETYALLDDDQRETGSTLRIYVRLSHFGKSVITEIARTDDKVSRPIFYINEETNENEPYQFRELNQSELASGRWGSSETFSRTDRLVCHCDKLKIADRDKPRQSGVIEDPKKGEKNEGKGKRDNSVNVKSGGKSSDDRSEVMSVVRSKKPVASVKKPDKPIRITKSAEEKVRKPKTTSGKASRVSKTLETSGSPATSGRKPRTTLRGGKRDGDHGKVKKINVGDGSESTNDYAKLLEQLRKRRRGVVTVGIDDKQKTNCPKTMMATKPRCEKQFEPTCERIFTNLGRDTSSCYHPRTVGCDKSLGPVERGCSVDSRVRRTAAFCGQLHRRGLHEMQIVGN